MIIKNLAVQMFDRIEQMPRNFPLMALGELPRGELFILNYLYSDKRQVHPGEISAAMETSTARTAAALGNMEKKGWLYREPDHQDRRQTLVQLTGKGNEYIQGVRQKMLDEIHLVLEELGQRDAEEYLRIFGRMVDIAMRRQDSHPHHSKER